MKEDLTSEDGQPKEGPDHFAYYSCQVKDLLSQDMDFLPSYIQSEGNRNGQALDQKIVEHGFSGSRSLFSNSSGSTLSDYKKEMLTATLSLAVRDLKPAVDEMIDPVLSLRELSEQIRSSESVSGIISSGDGGKTSEKENDLKYLRGLDNPLVEEMIRKHSNELSSTLGHMENKVEELLDAVASTCSPMPLQNYTDWAQALNLVLENLFLRIATRPMTVTEKLQLQRMIRNLPPENLNRVADIVQRQKPVEKQQCAEISVNLEQEHNVTLWRLYYYVQVVERAKKLATVTSRR